MGTTSLPSDGINQPARSSALTTLRAMALIALNALGKGRKRAIRLSTIRNPGRVAHENLHRERVPEWTTTVPRAMPTRLAP